MGNDIPAINDGKNQKNCCDNNDSGMSFLSIVESAAKTAAGAVQKAENFGAGLAAGAASALGLDISKETAQELGRGAIIFGVGGAAAFAAEQAVKHPAAAAAIGAGAVGAAVGAELLKGAGKEVGKGAAGAAAAACANECAKEAGNIVKDAAVVALVGGAAGFATGDATRAAALATMAAITGVAARCAAEMCKPGCCVKPSAPLDALKDIGKTVLDHITKRPIEAGAEAVLGGAPGVAAGAMIRRMLEAKPCENLAEKVLKNTCDGILKQAEMLKKLFVDPIAKPVIEMGPAPGAKGADAGNLGKAFGEAAAQAAVIVGTSGAAARIGFEAGKAAAGALKQTHNELEQHRKDNPTSSAIEQGAGYAAGGLIGGKAVGTAIEVADIKARQAYKLVKSWFE